MLIQMSCYIYVFLYLRAIRYQINPELTPALKGRPPAVSKSVIKKAIAVAEERDLNKDSFTSNSDVMAMVSDLMREEQEEMGHNPRAVLPKHAGEDCQTDRTCEFGERINTERQ